MLRNALVRVARDATAPRQACTIFAGLRTFVRKRRAINRGSFPLLRHADKSVPVLVLSERK